MARGWRRFWRGLRAPDGVNALRIQPVRLPSRPPSEPTHYLSVVAVVKNEGRYLREWIEFQRLMGAEHVYLYDNGSTDHTAQVLRPFVAERFVTVIPWATFDDERNAQRQTYAHAVCNFGPQFRWMAFIDLDEFLFPVEASTLVEALAGYEDCPCVCVPWFLFGFSGHVSPPEGLIIESYTQRAPFPLNPEKFKSGMWKSIANPAAVVAITSPHMLELTGGIVGGVDERRAPVSSNSVIHPPQNAVLRINHYITRSRQEFELKASRTGFGNRKNSKLRTIVDMIEARTLQDETILRFLPALRERMEAG